MGSTATRCSRGHVYADVGYSMVGLSHKRRACHECARLLSERRSKTRARRVKSGADRGSKPSPRSVQPEMPMWLVDKVLSLRSEAEAVGWLRQEEIEAEIDDLLRRNGYR